MGCGGSRASEGGDQTRRSARQSASSGDAPPEAAVEAGAAVLVPVLEVGERVFEHAIKYGATLVSRLRKDVAAVRPPHTHTRTPAVLSAGGSGAR